MLMAMTLVVPGSAQLVAGNRQVGRVAMRIWLAVLTAGLVSVVVGLFRHDYVFWLVTDTGMLDLMRFALMALAVGWAALFMDAWRLGQPLSLS